MQTDVEIIATQPFAGFPSVQFAKGYGVIYPLTPCCQASAKGTEGGICCRKCYQLVPYDFGMGWNEVQWADRQARRGNK